MIDVLSPGELVFANVGFKYKVKTKNRIGFKEVKKEINEMIFSRQYKSDYPLLDHEVDMLCISKLLGSKLTKKNHKVNEVYDIEVIKMDIIVRTGFINKQK